MESEKTRYKIEAEYNERKYSGKGGNIEFNQALFLKSRPYGLKRLIDKIGHIDSLMVLDIGSGSGAYSYYLRSKGAKVCALDISFNALRGLDSRYQIQRIVTPGEFLPVQDKSIDIIWCASALHHLDLSLAIKEFYRVLKPGGRCFFYEPLGHNPVVNLYRRLTPELRTPTERPLSFEDIKTFHEVFQRVDVQFFHLFALFPRALEAFLLLLRMPGKVIYRRIKAMEQILSKVDNACFKLIPASKKWAEVVALICYKSDK